MKVAYLDAAQSDMTWFRHYYRSVFPEGRKSAHQQFRRSLANLLTNPRMGKALVVAGAREHSITRTPFSFIYRINGDRLEILRVWDQRSDPEKSGFHEEAAIYA
jgi:toxin ParE1/3/4